MDLEIRKIERVYRRRLKSILSAAGSAYVSLAKGLREDGFGLKPSISRVIKARTAVAFLEMWSATTNAIGQWLGSLIGKAKQPDLAELKQESLTAVQESMERIHSELVDGLNDTSRQVDEVLSTGESKAETSATEGVLIVSGEVNRQSQEAAGEDRFYWMTMQDDRVRPLHVDVGERVYDWDSPPVDPETEEGFYPGEQPNCRCVAVPASYASGASVDVDLSDLDSVDVDVSGL